jgi:ribonuclease HI
VSLLTQAQMAAEALTAPPRLRLAPPPAAEPADLCSFHATVPGYSGAADVMVAATDASWCPLGFGYGYVTSTGLWGVHGDAKKPLPAGGRTPDVSTLHELRAVSHLLTAVPEGTPLQIRTDNSSARWYLRTWQTGDLEATPFGESLVRRTGDPMRSVRALARRLATDRHCIEVADVRAHSGDLLNEAADSLAGMVRRRARGNNINVYRKGSRLVSDFLTTWTVRAELREGNPTYGRRHRFTGPTPTKSQLRSAQ